jgi:hypothetical protein
MIAWLERREKLTIIETGVRLECKNRKKMFFSSIA